MQTDSNSYGEKVSDEYLIGKNWKSFENYLSNKSRGLLTGFPELDRTIVGFPGLTVVMGEPKCCKSTFVMNIVVFQALKGMPIILVDTENGLQRTRLRMICYLTGLTANALKSGNLNEDEQKKYASGTAILQALPIYFFISCSNPEALRGLIQSVGQKHKEKILLVVDSLQSLITEFKDRRGAIDNYLYFFNEIKQTYENWVTTILVSEKNRSGYGTSSKAGAKESGGIEYKGELVLDLFPAKDSEDVLVECVFNRDGDTGLISRLMKPNPYSYRLLECEYVPE